jgi:hypothetical protein
MALGTALLQPYAISRDTSDPLQALAEDIAKLIAIFAEDALAEGPLAKEAQAAVEEVGETIVTWFTAADAAGQTRQARAVARLNARFMPIRAYLQGLLEDTGAAGADPAQVIGLIRDLLALGRTASEAVTLTAIRTELEFLKSLLEDDLGFSPAFLSDRIAEFITVLRRRLGELPAPTDADARRRINLARVTLARLGLRTALLVPPGLDVEPMARTLHRLLQSSGVTEALREANCALDGIEASFNAAQAAGEAVATATQPVGAGVVPQPDAAEYSYFASFLMQDEDLPLVGLSELDTAEEFLTHFRTSDNAVIAAIRAAMTEAERAPLDSFTGGEPDRERLLVVVGALNRIMMAGPILTLGGGAQLIPDTNLPDDVKELRGTYQRKQKLFLYNRRLIDDVFRNQIKDVRWDSTRWFGRWAAGTFQWPHHQVYVTGDRRFVMCDDMPIHAGTDVKWSDAPIFAGNVRHGLWFKFAHASPEFCEIWAQVWCLLAEAGKAIWHTLEIQPGHEAQNATVCSIEYADLIQQVLFGKPISGHFLEGGPHLRRWGKSLDSFLGLKGIATFFSSFQGVQTDAPREKFAHWITVLMGDVFRTLGPIQTMNSVRDVMIGFVVLLNFGGPRDGPSTLPHDPARNHEKQAPFVALSDTLFAMLLISLFPRDNYSIMLFDPDRDDASAQKTDAFAVHWLAGAIGMGLVAGLSGSLVAQIIAWAEDFKRFFLTGAISAGKMFGLYWFYLYIFRENATDGGRYRVGGGSFRGYRDRASSPYLLPFPSGVARYAGQANLGLFSHNRITNSDFANPANNAVQQVYAYDFDHDLNEPIACSRAGVVWAFQEFQPLAGAPAPPNPGMPPGTGVPAWNFITIRHDTIDAEHDDFGNGPVQTFSVYGHLAQNGVTNAPAFSGTTPTAEWVSPGAGTPVSQGDLIALAGDTGMSFHNHLHMHVLPLDAVTGLPSTVFTIPFVFRDMRVGILPRNSPLNDGNLKSITWYRSRNG